MSLDYFDLCFFCCFPAGAPQLFFFCRLQAYHFMLNGVPSLFMIMKCYFVLPALCLLNLSAKLPSPHQEISGLRFDLLCLPLFVEFFCSVRNGLNRCLFLVATLSCFFSVLILKAQQKVMLCHKQACHHKSVLLDHMSVLVFLFRLEGTKAKRALELN